MDNTPKHIGIIMDGNRRFAKKLMMQPWKGHEHGAKNVQNAMKWCKEIGCHKLTLYTFSLENFKRPEDEFNHLMDLFRKEFDKLMNDEDSIVHKNKVKINFIGRLWMFPDDVHEKMQKLMEMTKEYSDYTVNFAVAYSGRCEIVDAAKKIAQKVKDGVIDIEDIDDKLFADNLYMSDEPDLIIRTSGERRISGFLIYQSDYAEYFFCDKMWPEFTKEDFMQAINDYSSRNRRKGR